MPDTLRVAVLGLGEADSLIAPGLAAAGCDVHGWDPARRLDGIGNAESGAAAVREADVVLSLNTASVARDVVRDVAHTLRTDAVYADLNTSAPALKRELARALPVAFADVALVGIVSATGLRTPALASGAGAARFAELFRPLGMPVDVVGSEPGEAAGLKLLRSVFMKGLAAAVLESVAAAERAGAADRVRADIVAVIGEPVLERLLTGSRRHAARRAEEMRAAAAFVGELGVPPRVAAAAAEWFEQLRAQSDSA
jgi:3-hydroxyisobutyrate dehydrogenase-like beta-hydroxyacid dehydrogenase